MAERNPRAVVPLYFFFPFRSAVRSNQLYFSGCLLSFFLFFFLLRSKHALDLGFLVSVWVLDKQLEARWVLEMRTATASRGRRGSARGGLGASLFSDWSASPPLASWYDLPSPPPTGLPVPYSWRLFIIFFSLVKLVLYCSGGKIMNSI